MTEEQKPGRNEFARAMLRLPGGASVEGGVVMRRPTGERGRDRWKGVVDEPRSCSHNTTGGDWRVVYNTFVSVSQFHV